MTASLVSVISLILPKVLGTSSTKSQRVFEEGTLLPILERALEDTADGINETRRDAAAKGANELRRE